MLGDF